MRRARLPLSIGAALWAAASAPAPALAAGFGVARFAAEHGHPTTDNASAIFYNPAALTLADESRALFDVTVSLRRLSYTRVRQPEDALDPPDAMDANVGRAEATNVLVGPALAGAFTWSGLHFGIGWFTPFGGAVSWNERRRFAAHPRLPGPVDGVQRWHSIEGQLYTTALSAAVARRVGSSFGVGLAVNLLGSRIDELRARGDGSNDVEREGRALLRASGLAVSVAAGVIYEPLPHRLWLGLSYQSRPNLGARTALTGTAEGNLGTSTRAEVEVNHDLPDSVRFGVRYRPSRRVELRSFGDWTRWSTFARQCIVFEGGACRLQRDGSQGRSGSVIQNLPRDFHDSFGVRAGASVYLPSGLEVFSGLGFESQAVPEETLDAGIADFAGFSFALGVKGALSSRLSLSASYTHFVFLPRDVASTLSRYRTPSRQPDASGHYEQFVGALNAHAELKF